MKLSLNTVILGPIFQRSDPTDPIAVIDFPRRDLTTEFVDKFFDPDNRNVRVVHPFAARGIETILTANSLIVIVHRGVALQLRNDVEALPGFRTFRRDDVLGLISLVTGEFVVSRDRGVIRDKLSHVWTRFFAPRMKCEPEDNCVRTKEGGYLWRLDANDPALPQYVPPRVVE